MIDTVTDAFIVKEDSFYAHGDSNKVPSIWIDFDLLFTCIIQEEPSEYGSPISQNVITVTRSQLKELHQKLGKIIEEYKV